MTVGTPQTNHDAEIRTATLVDLPVLRRLAEHATILDGELGCTREGVSSSLISSRFWSANTLIGRISRTNSGAQTIVGQFRFKPHDLLAQMVFLAPGLGEGVDNTAWLHMIDALTIEAGRRGAAMLTAEVDEDSSLFTTMRYAGFAVYARQDVWRGSLPINPAITPVRLVKETSDDTFDIQVLYSNIVPRLVQPIAVPSPESEGYVYREDGRVRAYVAVSEGKYGVYVMPYLHPDIGYREAAAIIAGAVLADSRAASRAERAPIYVCVRRYQDWLESALQELGFEVVRQQAVMVRHIAAGIRQAVFAPLSQAFEGMPSAVRDAVRDVRLPKSAPVSHLQPASRISRVSKIGHSEDFTSRRWNAV